MVKRICSIDGCSNEQRSRGFCSNHYKLWRKSAANDEVRGRCALPVESETELPCTSCGRVLPDHAFTGNRQSVHRRGKHPWCRECRKAAAARRYAEDPEAAKRATTRRRLKSLYGITPEELLALRAQQNERCAICGRSWDNSFRLCIDHDHVSGEVRGLLCTSCNLMLGYANDNRDLLTAAIAYLRKWSPSQ